MGVGVKFVQDLHSIGFYIGLVSKQGQKVGLCTWLRVGKVYRVNLTVEGGNLRHSLGDKCEDTAL